MDLLKDQWLSQRFGRPAWKLELSPQGDALDLAGDIGRKLARAAGKEPAFFYTKLDCGQADLARTICRAGFYPCETALTLGRGAWEKTQPKVPGFSVVETLDAQQREQVLEVAANCFVHSRFHQDPLTPNFVANDIKREWVANYIRGKRGEVLLTALQDGRPRGFLAVLVKQQPQGPCSVIDLLGVDATCQHQGVGRLLVEHFAARQAGIGGVLEVSTQAANLPSLGLYQNCGFAVQSAGYSMHSHWDQGRPLA